MPRDGSSLPFRADRNEDRWLVAGGENDKGPQGEMRNARGLGGVNLA